MKKIVEQNRNIAATDHWSGPDRPGSINVSDGGMSSCCCSIGFVGTEWILSMLKTTATKPLCRVRWIRSSFYFDERADKEIEDDFVYRPIDGRLFRTVWVNDKKLVFCGWPGRARSVDVCRRLVVQPENNYFSVWEREWWHYNDGRHNRKFRILCEIWH